MAKITLSNSETAVTQIIIATLFGAASLTLSAWTAWLGVKNDSATMGCMTFMLLIMASGFGSAAVLGCLH